MLREAVRRIIREEVWKFVSAILAGLLLVTGGSIWGGIASIRRTALDRIAKQFEEPLIRETLESVARDQASPVIEKQLETHVKRISEESRTRLDDFSHFLEQARGEIRLEQERIVREVNALQVRSNILSLADRAITLRDRRALTELYYLGSLDSAANTLAQAEIMRVKTAFLSGTRISGAKIVQHFIDGTVRENQEVPTPDLISALLDNEDWIVRSKAAQLLAGRQEKGVPEALLRAVKDEGDLEVLKTIVRSFADLTGFRETDVFEPSQRMQRWWDNNRKRVTDDWS